MDAGAVDVAKLLALAEPKGPAGLPSPDPGAVLALACHVVMVHAGLQSTLPSGAHPANKYAPRANWTREFKDEWRFSYAAPGCKRNSLLLHCSLQRASGRMLVHAVELGNPTNDHLLGLLLPKYVPDDTQLSQPSWAGVVHNTDALVPMLRQHILEPLLEAAVDAPPGEASFLTDYVGGQPLAARLRSLWHHVTVTGGAAADGTGSWVAPAVVCTALALGGVAAFVVMRRRRRV